MPNHASRYLLAAALALSPGIQTWAANVTTFAVTTGSIILTHPVLHQPPRASAFGTDNSLVPLPRGYEPLQVSMNGIVLLRDDHAFYRWKDGALLRLAAIGDSYDEEGTANEGNSTRVVTSAYMGGNGHIVIRTFREYYTWKWSEPYEFSLIDEDEVWMWSPDSTVRRTIPIPSFSYTASFDCFYDTRVTDRTAAIASIDDTGRIWATLGTGVETQEPCGEGLTTRLFMIEPDGTRTLADVPSGFRLQLQNHPGELAGVVYPEDGSDPVYYIGGRAVDFRPIFLADDGSAIGSDDAFASERFVWFPDGRTEPGPEDGVIESIDLIGRLHGYYYYYNDETDQWETRQAVWVRERDENGVPTSTVSYIRTDYVMLSLPNGWTTNLLFPPILFGPQVGIATNPAGATQPFLYKPVLARLLVDANRDGIIDDTGTSDATTKANPFRFWINDDDDSGDLGGTDIPDGDNYMTNSITGDGAVRGARDLIDLFPIYLDIKQLLAAIPPSASVRYRLRQADGALNFVYTNLRRDHAFAYQRLQENAAPLGTGFGVNLVQAPQGALKFRVTAGGFDLFRAILGGSPAFLDAIQNNDGGVILVEGRSATDKPLVLSVEKSDGTVIVEVNLEIKVAPIESMFRHLNLRDGANSGDGLLGDRRDIGPATRLGNPVDVFPDMNADQPWFIFVVGSNVGGQSARGWESETFKRLFWSRSKARFLGVSWFGDPYANGSDSVYDYHLAVRNSFAEASALASAVNNLPGSGSKTIAGHSLACGLIGAAISDHGMNITQACFVDAAIAREAFDGRVGSGSQLDSEESGMTPAIWRNYDLRFYASNWHERFASVAGDSRQGLTWRNRFQAAASKVHNFYSSTEDVLGAYDGEVPTTSLGAASIVIRNGAAFTAYVWVYQEKAKGNRQDYYLPIMGAFHAGSTYNGWGMNLKDPVLSVDPTHWKWVNSYNYFGRMIKTPAEIGIVSDSVLRRHPVFEPGWGVVRNEEQQETPVSNVSPVDGAPSWIYSLYLGAMGDALAGTSVNRARLLAEAIPALSLPSGSNETMAFEDRNYNLPVLFADPGWPRSTKEGVPEWRHSDMREIPYLYQSRFWDTLVSISQQP